MELPIGKVSTWVKRHPGYEAPGRMIDRAFLGRLAFRPSPFGALGLGQLARRTEFGPMVPTRMGIRKDQVQVSVIAEYYNVINLSE